MFTADAVFVDVLGRRQRGVIAVQHDKILITIRAGSPNDIRLLDRTSSDDGAAAVVRAHTASVLQMRAGPRRPLGVRRPRG